MLVRTVSQFVTQTIPPKVQAQQALRVESARADEPGNPNPADGGLLSAMGLLKTPRSSSPLESPPWAAWTPASSSDSIGATHHGRQQAHQGVFREQNGSQPTSERLKEQGLMSPPSRQSRGQMVSAPLAGHVAWGSTYSAPPLEGAGVEVTGQQARAGWGQHSAPSLGATNTVFTRPQSVDFEDDKTSSTALRPSRAMSWLSQAQQTQTPGATQALLLQQQIRFVLPMLSPRRLRISGVAFGESGSEHEAQGARGERFDGELNLFAAGEAPLEQFTAHEHTRLWFDLINRRHHRARRMNKVTRHG